MELSRSGSHGKAGHPALPDSARRRGRKWHPEEWTPSWEPPPRLSCFYAPVTNTPNKIPLVPGAAQQTASSSPVPGQGRGESARYSLFRHLGLWGSLASSSQNLRPDLLNAYKAMVAGGWLPLPLHAPLGGRSSAGTFNPSVFTHVSNAQNRRISSTDRDRCNQRWLQVHNSRRVLTRSNDAAVYNGVFSYWYQYHLTTQRRIAGCHELRSPNPKRVAAGKLNRLKRGALATEGRERLRQAAIENRPWTASTGPRTAEGKAQAILNGKRRQKKPLSVREIRHSLAEFANLASEMMEARRLINESMVTP